MAVARFSGDAGLGGPISGDGAATIAQLEASVTAEVARSEAQRAGRRSRTGLIESR